MAFDPELVAPVVASVNLVILLILTILWTLNRNVFPLRGRGKLFPFIPFFAACSNVTYLLGRMIPCPIHLGVWIASVCGSCATYSLYSIFVLFKFHISENLTEIAALEGIRAPNAKDLGWFLRRRHVIGPVFMFWMAFSQFVLIMIMLICWIILDPARSQTWDICPPVGEALFNMHAAHWIVIIYPTCAGAVAFVCGYLIPRGRRDGMSYKAELMWLGLTVVPLMLILLIGFPFVPEIWQWCSIMASITYAAGPYAMSLALPLAIAFRPALVLETGLSDLRAVLLNPVHRACFVDFLASEFSVENLMFWEEVTLYQREVKEQNKEVPQLAWRLYGKFVDEKGPYCVNVASLERQSIKTALSSDDESLLPTLFDSAQAQVWKLMQTDTFPRYMHSDLRMGLESRIKAGRCPELTSATSPSSPSPRVLSRRVASTTLSGTPSDSVRSFSTGAGAEEEMELRKLRSRQITAHHSHHSQCASVSRSRVERRGSPSFTPRDRPPDPLSLMDVLPPPHRDSFEV